MVKAVRQIGDEYGIAMLPSLPTPFSAGTLRASLAALLPVEPAPSPAVDVAEALKAGWLELWYQQKINVQTLVPSGAEALVRMRHPAWGVVPPAYFIRDDKDPHFRALSEFVIGRADRGLALSSGAARSGRSLDQPAGLVSGGSRRGAPYVPRKCPSIRRSAG